MSPYLLVMWGHEHVIKYKGREDLGLWRENYWAPQSDISSEITNDTQNIISSNS